MSAFSGFENPAFPVERMPLDPDTILNRPGMSIRQYAAIHLRVPDSGIPELDAMIRHARRQEMVGRALQGLLAKYGGDDLVSPSINFADAAIKAMEGKP